MYLTGNHASVTVQNGATRETSADTLDAMIDAMPASDLAVLVTVCSTILDYAHTPEGKREGVRPALRGLVKL